MSVQALSDYVFVTKYSRYNEAKQRRETYDEAVDRVIDMHRTKYAAFNIEDELAYCGAAMKDKLVLGSQRALQFGGTPILRKNARIYNCLHRDTPFVTAEGVRTFRDFDDGDCVTVRAPSGQWRTAVVRSFGNSRVNRVTIHRKSNESVVLATPDHRWVLRDHTMTCDLRVGDKLASVAGEEFDYDSAAPDLRVAWAYGFIYGDGTLIKDKNGDYRHSMVRLCDQKRRFAERFQELGFSSSVPPSLGGDIMFYTGSYLKTLPDLSGQAMVPYVQAFIDGLLCADGGRGSSDTNPWVSIQATGADTLAFLRRALPVAGWYITSETPVIATTNYGERTGETAIFRIVRDLSSQSLGAFTVAKIEPAGETDVWCLEVEDEQAFVLPNGLVTGNCTTSYCDRPRFFQECLWLLLCGSGTGFSVQKHHVDKLPDLRKPTHSNGKGGPGTTFVIPDTIEGWADALGVLLASYGICAPDWVYEGNGSLDFRGYVVAFDYSLIRPKGANLASGSGKAPGPDPLRKALEKIRALLDECVAREQTKLRPIDCYDIVMHSSDAVLSGGVRRSATICLFDKTDTDMLTAKTGDWFIKNPQRGRSNNSAVLLRDSTTRGEFESIMNSVKEYGEPGFVWCDSTEIMFNPCVEIGLYPCIEGDEFNRMRADEEDLQLPNGLHSGWAFCNLCEINAKACNTEAKWKRACKAAALLGTMQAGYVDFEYLGAVSKAIAQREALLGVSMTGIMDNPKLMLNAELQRKMAGYVLEINEEFAPRIGVRPTARATCVKPAGTTSCILGTSSGIHPHHAKRYFRRAQGNELETPLQYFALHNPSHVEPSVWSANGTDKSVIFCIETDDEAHTKETVNAVELLKAVRLTQQNWVDAGRSAVRCAAPFLSHNVSNTINVKPNEWYDVTCFIYDNRSSFAGISLLPHEGDRDYPQAPFCQVFTPPEIIEMYGDGSLFASGLIVDGLAAFENNLWAACDAALGIGEVIDVARLRANIAADYEAGKAKHWEEEGITPKSGKRLLHSWLRETVKNYELKTDWVRRYKQFADRYCGGDERKTAHLLKDVSNYWLWVKLNREYTAVDWSLFTEEADTTKAVGLDVACGGGACNIL